MKVEIVVSYLGAFTALLFNKPSSAQPFKRVYIDGFAGSGTFKSTRFTRDAQDGLVSRENAEV